MNERLLQYIWQYQYYNPKDLTTCQGEPLTIIHPGFLNHNQGPDFSDAKIKTGNTTWAGNIELHVRSSHWDAHGHDDDPNYSNVILHVVWEDDQALQKNFPVLELQHRVSKILLEKYKDLLQSPASIPCGSQLQKAGEFTMQHWKQRLLIERLIHKSAYVSDQLSATGNHWEEVLWRLLAKNFGARVNADAFEKIALSLSVSILARHKNQPHQLEALLLGQANILATSFEDPYCIMLQKEYAFLKKKYGLQPIAMPLHYLRMRPANFPTVRLAQLAMLIHQSTHLFSRILETVALNEVKTLLDVTANDYWHYHYLPGEVSGFKKKQLGTQMVDNLLINTIAPLLFSYGHLRREDQYKQRAIEWLEKTAVEKNQIVSGFSALGVASNTASDSQALIQLKNNYCNSKRCLECAIGNSILKRHP